MLQEPLFADWKDDVDVDNPEEMQKRDPLATQVWKLYHRAKTQLPNAERMENLTWRMMSMNLRRKEMERRGWVHVFGLRVGSLVLRRIADSGSMPCVLLFR